MFCEKRTVFSRKLPHFWGSIRTDESLHAALNGKAMAESRILRVKSGQNELKKFFLLVVELGCTHKSLLKEAHYFHPLSNGRKASENLFRTPFDARTGTVETGMSETFLEKNDIGRFIVVCPSRKF